MKLLITGGTGQLGKALKEFFTDALYPTQDELDLRSNTLTEDIQAIDPDYIINCAAIVGKVDFADQHPEETVLVNALAVDRMLKGMRDPSQFMQISTDFVFSENIYGLSKRMAEAFVNRDNGLVIRTSWLFGNGNNWVKWTLANREKPLTIVNDQIGRPTYAPDLARAIHGLVGKHGLLSIQNTGEPVSWYDYAKVICEIKGVSCAFLPISTEEYAKKTPGVAPRPKNSVFMDYDMPNWVDSLMEYIHEDC